MPHALTYPLKSHRKLISKPEESTQLAELMGIIFGDGGINNGWQLVISLNSTSDFLYSQHVSFLLSNLFNITVANRVRPNQNTLVLVCSSMNLLDFLIEKGAVRGNKINQKIDIPRWIKGNFEYEKQFVRGLVDTDGCLFIHKHTVKGKLYKNIGFCFTSLSESLIDSVTAILRIAGVKPHVAPNKQRIYLYEESSVVKYLQIFGSSNPRIYQKYQEWRGVRAA